MQKYKNIGGNSNITSYEIGDNYIKVQFSGNAIYLYTINSAGIYNINQMKQLAKQGQGLNSFINKYVRNKYEI